MIGYEWDESKAAENFRKHGVSFDEAVTVFDDPFAIYKYDESHSTADESRYNIIGLAGKRIIAFVAYAPKGDNMRIISAREAEEKEATEYAYNFATSCGNRTVSGKRAKRVRARHQRHTSRDGF